MSEIDFNKFEDEFRQTDPNSLTVALGDFHQLSNDYMDACNAYYQKPNGKNFEPIEILAEEQTVCFKKIADIVKSDYDDPKVFFDTIVALLTDNDLQRVEFINEVTGSNKLESLRKDGFRLLEGEIEGLEPEDIKDSLTESLVEVFGVSIASDTSQFIEMAHANSEKYLKRIQLIKRVRSEALDIGKIATGVVIGMAVAGILRRNKA